MRERLLVIDDEPCVLRVLTLRLRAEGYEVATALDGDAGLEAVGTQHPAVILLDLRMPKMDGLTVLARLRENNGTRSIPVIVLSASVVELVKRQALDLGARYFLEKPYDLKKLLEAIQSVLLSRQPLCSA